MKYTQLLRIWKQLKFQAVLTQFQQLQISWEKKSLKTKSIQNDQYVYLLILTRN